MTKARVIIKETRTG